MDNRPYYFDWAANGLMTPAVHEAVVRTHKALAETGSMAAAEHRSNLTADLRKECARFLHAAPSDIILQPNTSTLIVSLAATLQPHMQSVGVLSSEYPSLVLPFELHGYQVQRFRVSSDGSFDQNEYLRFLIDQKVGLAILSHVQWDTGVCSDIRRFCAECQNAGIVTLVDATQSMGILDLNVNQIGADIVVSSSYKWLQAGFGLAISSITQKFRERFPARVGGFGTMQQDGSLPEESATSFYEPGHLSSPTMAALLCSLRQKMKVGMTTLEWEAQEKMDRLLQILRSHGLELTGEMAAQKRGMIVSYRAEKEEHEDLSNAGFQCTYRGNNIRLSVHYSTPEKALTALDDYLSQR